MAPDARNMNQAVSRAIRGSLDGLQRQTEELHQAVADLIAACASSRPSNALPATLRAQTCAASLAASLETLGRFIASSSQMAPVAVTEEEHVSAPELSQSEQVASATTAATIEEDAPASANEPEFAEAHQPGAQEATSEPVEDIRAEFQPEQAEIPAHPADEVSAEQGIEAPPTFAAEADAVAKAVLESVSAQPASTEDTGTFDLQSLPVEQQDMHRRANRVAKVSMQDIQLIAPDKVRQGRENRDLCIRLNDEIGKARKEYERRFRPILGHGVDYFYHWMVEVLAAGDPEALGEYPYSTPALHR